MLKPLFWMFRMTGLSPNNTTNDKLFTASALIFVLLSAGSTSVYWNTQGSVTRRSLFWNILSLGYYVGTVGPIIKVHFNRKMFTSITERLSPSPNDLEEQRNKKSCEIFAFFALSVAVIVRMIHFLYRGIGLYHTIMRASFYLYLILPLVQMLMMVYQLKLRFSSLNKQLKEMPETSTGDNYRVRSKLQSVFREHADLRDIIEDINSYYTLVNVFSIFNRILYIIFSTFNLLVTLGASDDHPDVEGFLLIYTSLLLIIHADVCHKCSEQANETVYIAHRLLNLDSPLEIMEDVEQFSLGLFNNPVKFTAGGIFTLDRGLLTKATASAISYLIIAIQLKDVNLSGATTTSSATNVTGNVTCV